MSWRVVVISSRAKLDYKMDYLVVRNEDSTKRVHLSEISVLMIESTAVSLTAYLLCELTKRKINVIFCDEKRLPFSSLTPYYGSHDTSLKLRNQIRWDDETKAFVWAEIVRAKIRGQILVLGTANIFDVDFVSKNITTKINAEINSISLDYHNEINKVYEVLNSFGHLISSTLDFPARFSYVHESDKITKLLNFTVDTEDMTMPEKILEYMNICRRFFKKEVFAFLNLKCFLSREELVSLYKNIAYEGYRILFIESCEREHICEFENVVVIDNDLCII